MDPDASAPASHPRFWVGTSGYNYAEWKGSFYPEKISSKKMLPYYAERLPTVEINYTFYRMPTEQLLQGWSEITPEAFKFTLKAPRRITHDARLRSCGDTTRAFCDAAGSLGHKLGVLLFQLPLSFKPRFPIRLWYRTHGISSRGLILAGSDARTPPRRVTPCG